MSQPLTYLIQGQGAERELIEGLRRGEEVCYRHLYEVYAPRLQRTLERIFRDPQIASDALQSTFLKVFRKIDQFNERSSLSTWMTRIGIREAQELVRRQGSRRVQVVDPAAPSRTPEQQNADREMYLHLEGLIAALPLEKRTALLLFEIEGLSVQEIADITEEPRGTVLARLSRTRGELREAMRRWSDHMSESGQHPEKREWSHAAKSGS